VTCFIAFDVLQVVGHDVMSEPWTDRRKRLEDLRAALDSELVTIAPVAEDAARLWALKVGQQGGEGIVLEERSAPYRPGRRSLAWLKVKERVIHAGMLGRGVPSGLLPDSRRGGEAP
jgi:bifunctional non-homologous end joining protein LigD